MTTTTLHIPVSGAAEVVSLPQKVTLGDLRTYIEGYIEDVGFEDGHAYVDEEGKIKCLPENLAATSFLHLLGWEGFTGDYIAGPALVFGEPDDEGNETSVPERVVALAREVGLL